MASPFRSAALWLIPITACGGASFKVDDGEAGGQGGQSGASAGRGGSPAATGGAGAGGTSARAGRPATGGAPAVAGSSTVAGETGSAGEPGEGGAGGAVSTGDGGGAGTGEPVCSLECGDEEQCTATPTGAECRCAGGLVRDAEDDECRLPRSCSELFRYVPSLPSGPYSVKPEAAATAFRAYCGMMSEGGGWTLVLNEGPSFDPTTDGVADALCYSSSCTSSAYSLVPIESDVMLDVSDSPVATTTYEARLVVSGIHAMSRGKTLKALFTSGPNWVEAENNSNMAVRMMNGAECDTLPTDLAKIACQRCDTAGCKVPVMVFGDGDGDAVCRAGAVPRLAIGAATDYETGWNNCAGWPQDPDYAGSNFYPNYVRIWVR